MLKENLLLMREARTSLSGNWGKAAIITLVYILISGCTGILDLPLLSGLVTLAIAGPLSLGYSKVALNILRGEEFGIEQLFDGFRDFIRAFVAGLLISLFVFLFMLLLIVPGVIVALSFSMTFFILLEDDSIDAWEAMKRSKEMMQGHKLKLFYLFLRYIGWILLGILTLGIGLLWVMPYVQVAHANFYMDLKESRNKSQ